MSSQLFNNLERLDFLIRTKSTGSPSELARKLQMSERNLYYILDLMKDLGAPIAYSKSRKSYNYVENGRFSVGFIKNA